ncbi:MAG: DAK2 domain-containing protein, partial [Chloroflexi bacterium]|nr:DAK2 domain-containing protein [Chloroflexota bacterium]
SLARTPDLLPVLRDAGVVDSGGQGLVAILEGMLRTLRGESAAARGPAASLGALDSRWLADAGHAAHEVGFGYCTQFLLQGEALPVADLRVALGALGESLLLVGDERLLRIHVHALDPGAPLSAAGPHGVMLDIRIENMQEQHQAFVRRQAERAALASPDEPAGVAVAGLALVAVVAGEGMAQTARSLGAAVVNGGPTMNPSAAELIAAAEATGAETVIVLPNNANILLAARQAAELWPRRLLVVPTRSVPQGMAALMAAPPDPSADPDDVAAMMTAAAQEVRTLELTWAVRAATVDGLAVRAGQALALLDERAVAVADSLSGAASAALDRLPPGGVQLATVYLGADAHPEDTLDVLTALRERRPSAEVELVQGGQPHYPYLIALE